MEKKQSKFKEFVKKNKDIIICSALALAGGALAVAAGVSMKKAEKAFADKSALDLIGEFDPDVTTGRSLLQDMSSSMRDSNHATVIIPNGKMGIAEAGGYMIDYFESQGVDLDTQVTGMNIFLQK